MFCLGINYIEDELVPEKQREQYIRCIHKPGLHTEI